MTGPPASARYAVLAGYIGPVRPSTTGTDASSAVRASGPADGAAGWAGTGGIRRLGLAIDDDPLFASLVDAVRVVAAEAGLSPVDVHGPADEAGTDAVLIIGRPGRHLGLLGAPPTVPRIVWSGEPLGRLDIDRDTDRSMMSATARVPRRAATPIGRLARRVPLPEPLRSRRETVLAERLIRANLTELRWAAERGARLVVTSHDRAAILTTVGCPATVVPFGYHVALAGPLTAPDDGTRDLPLISLGARSGHLRRGRLLPAMGAGGAPVVHLERAWGADRDALLRRGRVMVDVHRIPGTFVGIRLVLALAAGVAVVTEPMPDPRPFVTGVTHLEAPVEDLLETARALVADEPRRRYIVEAGQRLLAERLGLGDSLRAVIASPSLTPPAG